MCPKQTNTAGYYAYVYVDDIFVNAELVRAGLACAKAYPPDTKHQDYLEKLEQEARQTGRSMWAK